MPWGAEFLTLRPRAANLSHRSAVSQTRVLNRTSGTARIAGRFVPPRTRWSRAGTMADTAPYEDNGRHCGPQGDRPRPQSHRRRSAVVRGGSSGRRRFAWIAACRQTRQGRCRRDPPECLERREWSRREDAQILRSHGASGIEGIATWRRGALRWIRGGGPPPPLARLRRAILRLRAGLPSA